MPIGSTRRLDTLQMYLEGIDVDGPVNHAIVINRTWVVAEIYRRRGWGMCAEMLRIIRDASLNETSSQWAADALQGRFH